MSQMLSKRANSYLTLPELATQYKEQLMPSFHSESWFSEERELKTLNEMKAFFHQETNPFERSCLKGHFTASCLLVNPKTKQFVLTHHRKLGLWLQLGGHADGMENLAEVALKEAEEESGLKKLSFSRSLMSEGNPLPVDFDIHVIPASKKDPEHLHLDVRFIVEAEDCALKISDESLDLKWFTAEEAGEVSDEESLLRLIKKYEFLVKA